jgi:hypothetical protein
MQKFLIIDQERRTIVSQYYARPAHTLSLLGSPKNLLSTGKTPAESNRRRRTSQETTLLRKDRFIETDPELSEVTGKRGRQLYGTVVLPMRIRLRRTG